ncbi:MAG: alpha-glucan family phosphorylase [Opitutaceae bacterium]|nr:alpha-glucan family phosphorylase [Opitutaceae bacterium]
MNGDHTIAYFSMEIAVDPRIPTYAGGLGVLAGDTLRAAADEGVPMVGLTLLHRKGYLTQRFDPSGWQQAEPTDWEIERYLRDRPERVTVDLEDRTVRLRAWQYEITGVGGHRVPVFLLDADLPENAPWDRTLTHYLYGGDPHYRLCQEVILGIGGVRMIRALGCGQVARFHLNEGHSSLLTLELLVEEARAAGRATISEPDIEAVKARCIFTTHTPVAAAHDRYPMDLVGRVLRRDHGYFAPAGVFGASVLGRILQREPGTYDPGDIFRPEYALNLTYLALNLSHYVNGVAKQHAAVSRRLFPKYRIDEITNGVHAATWTAPPLRALFDRHMPGWEADNFSLRYAENLPLADLGEAHAAAKAELLERVRADTRVALDPAVFTLGFARRFTPYKRADLLLTDPERLRAIAAGAGGLQVVFAGKAHPDDQGGKEIIRHILRLREALAPAVRVVYLENYDLTLARLLTAGSDLWLNTPLPPLEASGTSGMKAALNGVPSLSILDGWWLEGCIEGVTGWAIGERERETDPPPEAERRLRDAALLYDKLERVVAPCFYRERARYLDVMRHAIALNGSFFNTQRMIQQYVTKAYY